MTIATIFITKRTMHAIVAINFDADAYTVEDFRRRALNASAVLEGSMNESAGVDTNGVIRYIDFEIRVA